MQFTNRLLHIKHKIQKKKIKTEKKTILGRYGFYSQSLIIQL